MKLLLELLKLNFAIMKLVARKMLRMCNQQ
jgi:hypothetical protein